MWGKPLRWAVLTIVAAILCGHFTELFDHWYHTLRTGREAEYTLVVLAACAGLEIVLARALLAFATRSRASRSFPLQLSSSLFEVLAAETRITGPSPPLGSLSLRI